MQQNIEVQDLKTGILPHLKDFTNQAQEFQEQATIILSMK